MPTVGEASILNTVKKALGMDPGFTAFDTDIVMHINTVFSTLHQLGVGKPFFTIQGPDEKWNDFYELAPNLSNVQSYIFMKVKLMFDPPASAYGMQSLEKACDQLEWRMNVQAETGVLNAPTI